MNSLWIKQLYRWLFRSPSGAKMAPGAQVLRPFKVIGGSYLSIGRRSFIRRKAFIAAFDEYKGQRFNPRITIGSGVYIGSHVYLTAIREVTIGDGCVLSEYVYITDGFHRMDPDGGPIMEQTLESKGPVSIGPNCFLGFRCCVMSGVTLGQNCVVGANAVVTKSFPAYSMLAGVPAKVIKVFCAERKDWVSPDQVVATPVS